ncbi:hypothetical protein QBC44DRAFT_308318 [Cladorrhinum sp. PSN332]|nr:hypothetical protein QBC44DRAFT_308318 [Cladorrhinum sp. PSN332]
MTRSKVPWPVLLWKKWKRHQSSETQHVKQQDESTEEQTTPVVVEEQHGIIVMPQGSCDDETPPEGKHIDPEEWDRIEKYTFTGRRPGHPYSPDDPDKPEAYEFVGRLQGDRDLIATRLYENTGPPPYKFSRVANLPLPVPIEAGNLFWSSVYAAQREKLQLLDTRSYITSRIAEIDWGIRKALAARLDGDPEASFWHIQAQIFGALHEAGWQHCRDVYGNHHRPVSDPATGPEEEWLEELHNLFFVRERLSEVSLHDR